MVAEIHWSNGGLRVRCGESGFAVSGEGFTVWDEQLGDALEGAALLQSRRTARAPAHPPTSPTLQDSGSVSWLRRRSARPHENETPSSRS